MIMMQNIYIISILALVTLFGCNTSTSSYIEKQEEAPLDKLALDNGIYLIKHEFSDSTDFDFEKKVIIPFSLDFLDSNTTNQPIMLEIDTTEFVPLDLAEKPTGIEQKDKRIHLMLTLSDAARIQLANFTERHINKRVAIVIGNKAVTKHKIRTRIEGGRLQITRCTDNACKYLLVELRNNYKQD